MFNRKSLVALPIAGLALAGVALQNQRTGLCIDAPYYGNPGPVTMLDCLQGRTSEEWYRGADSASRTTLINAAGNLCLTTDSVGNGTVPRVTYCDLSDHYDWWDLHW